MMYYIDSVQKIQSIEGALKIILDTFNDIRGEIWTVYSENDFLPGFVEDKVTISYKNVLRGLHGDPLTGKLITCLSGKFQLAMADMRKSSPTYANTYMVTLDDRKPISIYVPPGCINGHLCLSDRCVFHYKWTEFYTDAANQATVSWDDSGLNLPWLTKNPILSNRDQNGTSFKEKYL